MDDEVKAFVDLKLNVFKEYFTVPAELQPEMERFVQDICKLGESCQDASEFENRFNSEGLVERYNSFFPRCAPKQRTMTKAEIGESLQTAGSIINADREEIIKDETESIARGISGDIADELIAKNRERMIEEGTFDDFTRASNAVDDVGSLLGFLGKKLGGKKR